MLTIAPDDASGDEKGFIDDIRPSDGPTIAIPFRFKAGKNRFTGAKLQPSKMNISISRIDLKDTPK
jgi:hypothetical protein